MNLPQLPTFIPSIYSSALCIARGARKTARTKTGLPQRGTNLLSMLIGAESATSAAWFRAFSRVEGGGSG